MREKILTSVQEATTAVEQLALPTSLAFIEEASLMLAETFRGEGKLIIAGNGGSLCDAAHFSEELVGIFRKERAALPAIVLSEPGFLSCVGNDLGYDRVFARGVEAYGKPGDLFVGLTTSGNSRNLIAAFEVARRRSLRTIAFLGRGGGKLRGVADLELIIDGFSTSDRVQEAHMTAIHIVVEMVEHLLFEEDSSLSSKIFSLIGQ